MINSNAHSSMTPSVKNFNYNKKRSIDFSPRDPRDATNQKESISRTKINLIVEATPRHFVWRQPSHREKKSMQIIRQNLVILGRIY